MFFLDNTSPHDIIARMETKLRFSTPNAKLKALAKRMAMTLKTFTLPSGFTCPGALECLSKANRETGKITDGPETKFRCFQASAEAVYPSLRNMVWNNFDALTKGPARKMDDLQLASLIEESLPGFDILRVHVGGDFFSQKYFDAWLEVARRNPSRIFYAYTKSIKFWVQRFDEIPENFVLTASRGGTHDFLIDEFMLKEAVVVFSEEEAEEKGLEIDHDDYHAAFGKENFALLLHGTQPKGSDASEALKKLRKAGKGGYPSAKTRIASVEVAS